MRRQDCHDRQRPNNLTVRPTSQLTPVRRPSPSLVRPRRRAPPCRARRRCEPSGGSASWPGGRRCTQAGDRSQSRLCKMVVEHPISDSLGSGLAHGGDKDKNQHGPAGRASGASPPAAAPTKICRHRSPIRAPASATARSRAPGRILFQTLLHRKRILSQLSLPASVGNGLAATRGIKWDKV